MDDRVTFVPNAIHVGAVVHSKVEVDDSYEKKLDRMADEDDPRIIVERWERHARQRKTATVLRARDGVVEQASVRYDESSELFLLEGVARYPPETPIARHDYLVSAAPDGPTAEGQGGGTVTPDELAMIQTDEAGIGAPDPWQVGAPTGTLGPGDTAPSLGPAIKRLLDRWAVGGGGYRPTPCRMEIHFRAPRTRASQREAVFDVTVQDEATTKDWSTPSVDLAGQVVLRLPDGRPIELHLSGKTSKGARTMEGPRTESGVIDLRVTWMYR